MNAQQALHDPFNYGQYLADAIMSSMKLVLPGLTRLNEKPTAASIKAQGMRVAFIPTIDSAKCLVGFAGTVNFPVSHVPIDAIIHVSFKMIDVNGREYTHTLFADGIAREQSDGSSTNDQNEAIERATERATTLIEDDLAKRMSSVSFVRDAMR